MARGICRRGVLALLGGCAATGSILSAADAAPSFPTRLIRLVVPFPAGSATDTEGRFLAEAVGKTLGQTIIVENRPGANGNIGATDVARATPDGYKLLLATNSSHSANIHLYAKLPYDPVKDFAPVARLTRNPLVLVVSSKSHFMSLKDLLQAAKEKPKGLSYGTGNTGSLAAAQLIQSLGHVELTRVPYQGTPAAMTDLLGGRIDLVVTDVAVVRDFVRDGSLRALGVTTSTPIKSMPGVPTIAEAGLPGYEFTAWSGLFAPAGTPAGVIDVLSKSFIDALETPSAKTFFDTVGLEPDPGNPEVLARHVATQTELWGRIIRDTGLAKI